MNGVSICRTEKDWLGQIWFLDLSITEILTRGCRRRSNWVLEEKTPADVVVWVRSLRSPYNQYADAFEDHEIDGPGLTRLSLEHMQDIGIRQIGHRYTLKSLVKDFILSAEKDLYKEGKYNAPQSDLDFIGGKGGAYGIKSTAQDFPRDLATVTSEWLTLVLGEEVSTFDSTPLEMGVLSDLGLIKLNYKSYKPKISQVDNPTFESTDPKGSGKKNVSKGGPPASVVIKFAKGLDASRDGAVDGGAYKKELVFFEDLANSFPVRCPNVLATFKDADKPDEYFCIVMEDMLAAGYRVMDQITGISWDECIGLCEPVTTMHAKFWESPLLDEQ